MHEYFPLLLVGGTIGVFSVLFVAAWVVLKRAKLHSFERHMSDSEIIRRLLHYAKPHWKSLLLAFFFMVLAILHSLVSPLLVGYIQELVSGEFELGYLYAVVIVYCGVLLVSVISTYLQAMVLQKMGQKILSQIRLDLFTHIESLSHGQLSQIPVGKLVTRVTNDPNSISYMFTNILVTLAKNLLVIVGVLVAMLLLNYTLTLMILSFVPVLLLFTVVFRAFSRTVHRSVTDATTDINTFLSENLSGMKITQIFNQEDNKMEAFRKRSNKLRNAKFGRMAVFGVFRPMVQMLNYSAILFLLYLGGKGYIQNTDFFGQTITASILVAFYMYIGKFFNPIQQLAEQFDMLQKSFASAEKIFTIMDMEPELVDEADAIELESIRGEIEFRDVWFAYEPEQWVLKGVSFHVKPGQAVAFVGATGSGKTTILSLICRNYDIQKGQILIDGMDIRKIKTSSLRRHFGQMLQDVFLFAGTIRSNITLGLDATEEEILQACRYVNANSFIEKLEKGLDEEVRERGNNFSAGQRQLLSFARTVLHKPGVMILDEATANIDTETELLIQDSLEKMKNIGTMLIVAHRLSTIQHADNIILLSNGQIMEQGNHQQLLAQKGRYYKLYTLQYQLKNG